MNTKIILVTGASHGFGPLMAETLHAAGHRVFAGIRDINGGNAETAEALRARAVETIPLDVTNDNSVVEALSELLLRTGGKLDVVINNAGIASAGVSESFTPEQVRDLFEVNVFGIQRVLRATLPTLRAQNDGLVINVGSVLGRVTFPFFGLYGASKHAVEALTDSYRYELSQLGVDMVLVQPGAYPTNILASAQKPADGTRGEAYGEVGAIPGTMLAAFMETVGAPGTPDPNDVAATIARLIAMPRGQRPERMVVGQPFGADAVNSAVALIQRRVVDRLGLNALVAVKA